jgi:hypothetical protein
MRQQKEEATRRMEEIARLNREALQKRKNAEQALRERQRRERLELERQKRQEQEWARTIGPHTPARELLPAPPQINRPAGPLLVDDLSCVPEVQLQASLAKDVSAFEARRQIARQIIKINHLNDRKTDGFLEALCSERLDLNGLPLAMGDACRTEGERSKQFATAVATVRRAQPPNSQVVDRSSAANFWEQYQTVCDQQDRASSQLDRSQRESVTVARIAALMQVLAPMGTAMHLGLVKYLSTVSHIEATQALARLAIFSTEGEVRRAALDALKVRRERDYTAVLLRGLHYPWPAVAERAAEAIIKLERTDLRPQLVALLEGPDPRAPVMEEVNHQRAPVVRELVRVNHHRNCLLCHTPGNTGGVSRELTAAVPVPGETLPSPSDGYRASSPDLIVRFDVTYLRQDFSALQPVADGHPWPEMQRFDFLVRTRVLSEEEAKQYRDMLTPREPGGFTPYQRAALTSLRELTGRDTELTP